MEDKTIEAKVRQALFASVAPLSKSSLDVALTDAFAESELPGIFRATIDEHIRTVATQTIKHWLYNYFSQRGVDDKIRQHVREQLNELFGVSL